MICKYCGCELKDTAKFCNGCGNPTGVIRTEIFETGFYEAEDTGYESAPVHVTFSPETVSFSPEAVTYAPETVTYAPETVTFSPEPSTLELTNPDEPKTLDLASADTFIAIPHPKVTEPAYETEPVDLGPVGELRRILAKNPYSKSSLAYISNYAIPDNYNELYEYMALIASKIDRHEINREEMDREVILSRILFAKFELAYQKANIKFGDSPEFEGIQNLYSKTVKEKVKKESLVTNILLALIIVFMLFAIGFGVFFYTQTNKSINDSKEDKYSVSEEKKKSKKKAKEDEVISTDGLPGVNSYLPGTGTELPNATAEDRENVIPLEFTDGFEKAEYDKYNSRATDNGLKGTLIYFTGELKEIELIENSGSNTIFGYVTDYAGHKWMVCMNSEQYVAGDYYDEYIGKEVCVRGRYNGYAVDFECPFVFLDELYIVGSGERVNGAMKYE